MAHTLLSLQTFKQQAKQPMPAMWHDGESYGVIGFSYTNDRNSEITTGVREGSGYA